MWHQELLINRQISLCGQLSSYCEEDFSAVVKDSPDDSIVRHSVADGPEL